MINLHTDILDKLNEKELYLLMQIARHVGKSGLAWPSVTRLVKLTGWSKVTVKKYRDDLIKKGYLQKIDRVDKMGRSMSALYRLKTNLIGIYLGGKDIPNGEGSKIDPRGSESDDLGGQKLTPGGSEIDPEVLSNEVLSKEEIEHSQIFDLQSDDLDGNPAPPEKEVQDDDPANKYRTSTMNDFNSPEVDAAFNNIYTRVKAYHEDYPGTGKRICQSAKKMLTPEQYWELLKTWIRWNAESPEFYKDPIKRLSRGSGNFIGWIKREEVKKPAAESNSTYAPNRVDLDKMYC